VVLQLLTLCVVLVVYIRGCTDGRRPDRLSPQAEDVRPADVVPTSGGVVVPFPRRTTETTG
jgi:hypothetical protein